MTAATNYDDAISQLRASGLELDQPVVDGRIHRVRAEGDRGKSRSGWYSLHEWVVDGRVLLVGAYGSFREGTGHHKIEIRDIGGRKPSPEERAALRKRVQDDQRRAEARRRREQERAAAKARAFWDMAESSGECAYLHRKGVQGHGVRYRKGNLLVPLLDTGDAIHGLQIIYGDPAEKERRGRDKDFWPFGLAKRGHFHLIGRPDWIVLLAEGYATGASIHEATGFPVAVAFDAGNLQPVAEALRKKYRRTKILVCGDDDFLTRGNPGVTAASTAAMAVGGHWLVPDFGPAPPEYQGDPVRRDAAYATIDFDAEDYKAQAEKILAGRPKLTDFNDLHAARGLHVVGQQIEAKLREIGWRSASAATPQAGEVGREQAGSFSVETLLARYALIYGTETVFDWVKRRIIGLGPLRSAAGKSNVRQWLEDHRRRLVDPEEVVFDPQREPDDPAICNLWGGWPTVPRKGNCEALLDLLEYLCRAEEDPQALFRWILRWLAYPIQNPGAKMQTAVLMHGPEGGGKNTFFGAVRRIYDKYGGIFSQAELESQFNGWASGKLFMIGNEVVTRVELYHQQGRLKNMITEPEWQVNDKNLPVRQEANHCNFVFFSNRVDIAKLDRDDRRYCVVWTPAPPPESFIQDVVAEIRDGGVEALHDYLLNLDLGDFNPHTKPPITKAKKDLIELSMDSTERFWRDWSEGHLPVPYGPVASQNLYQAYRAWAAQEGIPKPAPNNILMAGVGKKPGVRKDRRWYIDGARRRQSTFVIPPGCECDPGGSQERWLGDADEAFQNAMRIWKEGEW